MPIFRSTIVCTALLLAGQGQAGPADVDESPATAPLSTAASGGTGKGGLSLALPDGAIDEEAPAPGMTGDGGKQALPELFDKEGSSGGVEFDGKVSTRDDAPLTAPEVHGVEVQMKSRF